MIVNLKRQKDKGNRQSDRRMLWKNGRWKELNSDYPLTKKIRVIMWNETDNFRLWTPQPHTLCSSCCQCILCLWWWVKLEISSFYVVYRSNNQRKGSITSQGCFYFSRRYAAIWFQARRIRGDEDWRAQWLIWYVEIWHIIIIAIWWSTAKAHHLMSDRNDDTH